MVDAATLLDAELSATQLANFVFGSMDRVVHRASDFAVGLSLSFLCTDTYESINTENLGGWHAGEGMTYLHIGGRAHFSDAYWPAVNPRRLPGMTVEAAHPRANGSGQSTNPSFNWVGGVSLGRTGAAGLRLDGWSNTLPAKKSWFIFGHEILCRGSGITSTDNRPIETAIENRLIGTAGNGALNVEGAAKPVALGRVETLATPCWSQLAARTAAAEGD